jgi:hypothetical protein
MNRTAKTLATFTAVAAVVALGGCSASNTQQRDADNAAVKKLQTGVSLEKTQLTERLKRQNKASAVGYVYLLNFGKPFGYYVIKGKVSNSGSQLAPEEELVRPCGGCDRIATDGPQDDGTYGTGDPGIFFFTATGVMVETSVDYIYSDQPLELDVPLLQK